MSSWQEVLDLQLRLHRALGQRRIPTFIAPEIREHLDDGIEEAMSSAKGPPDKPLQVSDRAVEFVR